MPPSTPPPATQPNGSADGPVELPDHVRETYDAVRESNDDFIKERELSEQTKAFCGLIDSSHGLLKFIILHHLQLLTCCHLYTIIIAERGLWEIGRFNVGIQALVEKLDGTLFKSVWFRIPIPEACGEDENPRAVEEKIRVEAGTHVWMVENVPTVRLPQLFGFSFASGIHFTHVGQLGHHIQVTNSCQRALLAGYCDIMLSMYSRAGKFETQFSYLLYEHVGSNEGIKLETLMADQSRADDEKYLNLYAGIANMILAMARWPQKKIGSFRFNNDGTVTLSARPQFSSMLQVESSGIAPAMANDATYSDTNCFCDALIAYQRKRLLDNRAAVSGPEDCKQQMGTLAVLKTMTHRFIKPEYREGPFVMQFTELDLKHLVCDSDWNVRFLLDTEFISVLPVEMLQESPWVTGRGVDTVDTTTCFTEDELREKFLNALFACEAAWKPSMRHDVMICATMNEQYISGVYQFWDGLISNNGLVDVVQDHLSYIELPQEVKDVWTHVYKLWGPDADEILARKVADRVAYLDILRRWFYEHQHTLDSFNDQAAVARQQINDAASMSMALDPAESPTTVIEEILDDEDEDALQFEEL